MTMGVQYSVWHTPTGFPRGSICLIDHGVPPSEELHGNLHITGGFSFFFDLNCSHVLDLLDILNNQISGDDHMTDNKQYSSTGSATT
jgi:hypothetical protein